MLRASLVYRLLRWVLRSALKVHYTNVEVHGAEQIPTQGPLLLLANHHNGMVDPMLVIASSERPVRYIAKSTLFKIPVLGFFMRQLGCIPAWRKQDPGYVKEKNLSLYDAVGEVLAQGDVVGIFPEGRSHTDPGIGELKHGAARMAFEAEAARGFQLGLRVQLIGIHFEDTRGWRGKVLVHFAEPVALGGDAQERFEGDPRQAVDELTQELRGQLAEMVLDAETARMLELADIVEGMDVLEQRETKASLPEAKAELKRRFDHKQRLIAGYRAIREEHPEAIDALVHKLHRYRRLLELLGVRDGYVAQDYRLGRALLFTLRHTSLLILGSPLFIAGTALNVIPYWVARGAARIHGGDIDARVSVGLIVGILIFPLWYAGLVTLSLWQSLTPAVWIPIVASGPILGLFTARWLDTWRRLGRATWGLVLTLRMPACRERLRTLRREILADVDRLLATVPAGDSV